MFVGRFEQSPVTPGLIQLSVFPPADPETANVPVQALPVVEIVLYENVPVNVDVSVVPEIVPFADAVAHVPDTEPLDSVRFMTMAMMNEPVAACVPANVPVQLPATLANDGAVGPALHADMPQPKTTAAKMRFTTTSRTNKTVRAGERRVVMIG